MYFIHVADTHLGKRNFKLEEREKDFLENFEKMINFAIENKVDFIVHSGDLFDKARPKLAILRFLTSQLKRLKEANIKFFVIPGSHDIGSEGTFITFLDDLNLLCNLASSSFITEVNNRVIVKGVEYKDAYLAGVSGRRGYSSVFERLIARPKDDKFSIFLFHYTVSSIPGVGSFYDIPESYLPKGFDYYAAGHYHIRNELSYNGKPLIYPGSLDYCSIDEVEKNNGRGFYLIEFENKEIRSKEFIDIGGREFVYKKINCNNLDYKEVVKKVLEVIPESNQGILILRLFGKLSKGRKRDIDKLLIERFAKSKGYIYTNLIISDLLDEKEEKIEEFENKSVEEIEREYLKLQKYNDKEIELGIKLINILGNCEKGEEEIAKARSFEELLKFIGEESENKKY